MMIMPYDGDKFKKHTVKLRKLLTTALMII